MSEHTEIVKVRLDKWLWAARFFKTRNLAKQAVEGGKVHLNGARTKAGKDIVIGQTLEIRQGYDNKIVIVRALSDRRRSAKEAVLLYEETEESIRKREASAANRKNLHHAFPINDHRPNKKDRRKIKNFKEQM